MTSASQSVLEHTDATSTRPLPASLSSSLTSSSSLVTPSSSSSTTATTPRDVVSVARNDLRSMSQRLERLLRERREATERRPQQERSLERRTLDILDRRLGRGAADLSMPAHISDSSPSDSEEERGEEGRARRRESRRDMMDFFDHESFLRNRRISRSAVAAAGDTWRPLSMRERLDIRAGLRRETERERMRLSRERDLSLRRVRYRSDRLAQAQADRSDRLPPLRELIWRRLRRRTGQQGEEGEEEGGSREREPREGERSRHREFLSSVSWAVDQLTIDPEGDPSAPEPAEPSLPPVPPPNPRPAEPGPGGAARVTGPARFLQGRLRGEWGRVGEGENTWGAPMPDRRPPPRRVGKSWRRGEHLGSANA